MSLANQGHTLQIVGDRSDNHIAIVQDERGVHVTADGAPAQNFTGIDLIQVSTGDGNDDVRTIYAFNPQPDPPGLPFHVAALQVSLGGGNDSFNADGQFPPGPCRISVDAGIGNDAVSVNYGFNSLLDPTGAPQRSLDLIASLGAGDDSFTGNIQFPPGPCRVGVDGGVGNDVVTMHTVIGPNDRSTLSPTSQTATFYANLGAGNDVFNGDFEFPPDPCQVMVMGGDGNDAISISACIDRNTRPSGIVDPNIQVSIDAGTGDDVVSVSACIDRNSFPSGVIDPNLRSFDLLVRLGAGNDRFDAKLDVPPDPYNLFPPGPCRITVMGEGGADSISTLLGSLATPAMVEEFPALEISLDGGDGNDSIRSVVRDVNLNGRTSIDLQGGTGNDLVQQTFDMATANAGLDLNANGGAGDDYVVLSSGSDTRSTTGFAPTLFVNSQVNLNVQGDLGNDRLIGMVIPCIKPQGGALDMVFSGGSGNDIFGLLIGLEPVSLNPPSDHNPPGDMDGPITLTVIGGEGDDQLNLTVQNLGNSTSPLAIRLVGSPGRDTAIVTPGIDVTGWIN